MLHRFHLRGNFFYRKWSYLILFFLICIILSAGCVKVPNLDYQPNSDIIIVKLSPNATMEWAKIIDTGGDDHIHSILQTPDNNYVIVASSQPGRHPGTYGLMKFSQNQIFWNVSLLDSKCGGPIILAGNGDLIAAGLCRINPDGILLWNRSLPDNNDIYAVIQTSDGGFLIGGDRFDDKMSPLGPMAVKTDQYGNLSWQVLFGKDEVSGSVKYLFEMPDDQGYIARTYGESVQVGKNGEVVSIQHLNYKVPESDNGTINGESLIKYIPYSPGLIFYNQSGLPVANLVLKNATGSISRTADNGYISADVRSSISHKATDKNLHLIKFLPDGSIEWDRDVSGILINGVSQIIQTSDGGYIVAGEYDKEWE